MKIGIVNLNRLLDDSKRGRALSARLKGIADKWQAQMLEAEGKLEKARQALAKATPNLAAETLFKLQRDVRIAEMELRHADELRRYDIEAHREHLRAQVLKELEPVFSQVASERGLSLILGGPARQIAWSAAEVEVTEEVMARYDQSAK